MTHNSHKSLENAVVIAEPKVAQMYFSEWKRVLTIDWTSAHPAPDHAHYDVRDLVFVNFLC